MNHYHIPLEPNNCYHLFNHAIGDDLLFRNDETYGFFLKKYTLHTDAICDTLSYTLMPNHFHFAVRIKSLEECANHFDKIKKIPFEPLRHHIADFLMEHFSNLCNSYAKSYNKVFDRRGSLFIDYMKRSAVGNDTYMCNLINYIHFNAVHHGFCKTPLAWKWTSLHAFLAAKKTRIRRKETLQMFGGFNEFKIAHGEMVRPLAEYEFL
jgi:putative transposase